MSTPTEPEPMPVVPGSMPTEPEPVPVVPASTPAPTKPRGPRRGLLIALVSLLVIIVILASTLYIVGRNGTGPLASLAATPTPTFTPTPPATPTPLPPPPHFKAATNDPALSLTFDADAQHASITAADMMMSSGFGCANTYAISNQEYPSPSSMTWPITNGQFTIDYTITDSSGSSTHITIDGSFSASNTQASGNWTLTWITNLTFGGQNQANCSGTWTATSTQ